MMKILAESLAYESVYLPAMLQHGVELGFNLASDGPSGQSLTLDLFASESFVKG